MPPTRKKGRHPERSEGSLSFAAAVAAVTVVCSFEALFRAAMQTIH